MAFPPEFAGPAGYNAQGDITPFTRFNSHGDVVPFYTSARGDITPFTQFNAHGDAVPFYLNGHGDIVLSAQDLFGQAPVWSSNLPRLLSEQQPTVSVADALLTL